MIELLKTVGLSKHFDGLKAVDGVDFFIHKNETVGIIGPNGSGKTTFFNLLSGFYRPTEGSIVFLENNITNMPIHKRVSNGMIRTFQLVSVFNKLSVWENLVLSVIRFNKKLNSGWRFLSLPVKVDEIFDYCFDSLKIVGLTEYADKLTSELSYGSKRMLEIAIALSLKPKLLLLDEPLSGLSDIEITEVQMILNKIKTKTTLIIIEHKISKIINLVERLCVMNEGHILYQGVPEEVLKNPSVRECYWGKEKIWDYDK